MHNNSKLLFEKYVLPVLEPGMKVLEIGPNGFPSSFQLIAKDVSVACWDTLDIFENPKLTYQKSPEYDFPIEQDTYDVVLSGSVIEHVKKPWKWIPELARIIKPNGLLVTIGPVSWVYHEDPVDCWRIYPEGMKALLEDAGLETVLCCWESLEAPGYRNYVPGVSRECRSHTKQFVFRFLGMFGFPVERAYDTVSIGRKKSH